MCDGCLPAHILAAFLQSLVHCAEFCILVVHGVLLNNKFVPPVYSGASSRKTTASGGYFVGLYRTGQAFLAYRHCALKAFSPFLYAIRRRAVGIVSIVVVQRARAVDVALIVGVGGVRSTKPPARNIQGLTYISRLRQSAA